MDTSRKVLAHAAAQIGVQALAERVQFSTRTLHKYLTGGALVPELPIPSAPPGASRSRRRDP